MAPIGVNSPEVSGGQEPYGQVPLEVRRKKGPPGQCGDSSGGELTARSAATRRARRCSVGRAFGRLDKRVIAERDAFGRLRFHARALASSENDTRATVDRRKT